MNHFDEAVKKLTTRLFNPPHKSVSDAPIVVPTSPWYLSGQTPPATQL